MNPSKCAALAGAALALCWIGRSTVETQTPAAGAAQRSRSAEKQGLAEPFKA